MTTKLRSLLTLIAGLALFLPASDLFAQTYRADSGPFVRARIGLSIYGGDRDNNPDEDFFSPNVADKFENAGLAFGADVGYILSKVFSVSIGYHYGKYDQIITNPTDFDSPFPPIPDFPALDQDESSKVRHTIPALLRAQILPSKRFSPFVQGGVHATLASFTLEGESSSESETGFGPSLGVGVDVAVSNHASLTLEWTAHLVFGDDKADLADADVDANETAYDGLGFLGVGFRYSFEAACSEPTIRSIDAPDRIAIGEPAAITANIADDACRPVDIAWDFGDGESGSGLGVSHTFATPGTYTVRATATNSAGSDDATATVEVFDPCPVDAEIIAINLDPSDPIINEAITFTADVRGTAPVSYSWSFGDGGTASGATVSHVYTEPGEYTVTLECSNCGGTDTRSITIVVQEFRCGDITELNSVFFDRNSSALDDEAQSLLFDNIDVLNECPDLLTRIDGYSDRRERRPQRLSEQRAATVEQFYIDNGIAPSRLSARGLGLDPLAGKGIDGRRNRRVDSIIVDSFEQMQE